VNIKLGEVIKVSLINYLQEKRNCPFWDVKGQFTLRCFASHLPEPPSAGIGTVSDKEIREWRFEIGLTNLYSLVDLASRAKIDTLYSLTRWLPRFRRAGPSTSLDKSAVWGYRIVAGDDTMNGNGCQTTPLARTAR
jgi:hypothetical protein